MSPLLILLAAIAVVVVGVLALRLHPFVVLVAAAFVVALLGPVDPEQPLAAGRRVAEGFGRTALDVGIVIAMASILGTCLSEAGGARRIVLAIQWVVGTRRTPLALLLAGFVLGIPMFAETVFYLLVPLARAAWERTGRGYLLCVLAIVAGATMTHSLVPPTPGPLFVASALGVDIAMMIGVGLTVGFMAAGAGFAFAVWADHRWPLVPSGTDATVLRETQDALVAESAEPRCCDDALPPLWASCMPILLPIVLISLESASRSPAFPAAWVPLVRVVGEKNLALALAAVASILLLAGAGAGLPTVRRTVAAAVTEAGSIILVISAGGALGAALRESGLTALSAGFAGGAGLALVPLAWLVTAVIRVAQGSATVAMITAAGVMGPLVAAADLPFHPVYVAVAIGCGSKMGMWMNDAGFWVISRMSGMSEWQTLRSAAAMVAIEGMAGLAVAMVLATLLPLQ